MLCSHNFRNLPEAHEFQAARLGPLPALRYKQDGLYHDLTWEQYRADALACAAAMVERGVALGDRIGLLAENRVEWLVADLGLMTAGAVNVPPHAPLTAKQIHFQLQDAGVSWLLVSTREQLCKIREIAEELPLLRGTVVFDWAATFDDAGKPLCRIAGKELWSWDGFLQHGRRCMKKYGEELAARARNLGRDDLATVMYTSGTTGNPKGVMLTHGNLLSNACSIVAAFHLAPDAVLLSWLPYSHIYARTVDHYLCLISGNLLCLAESAETLVENLKEVQPTFMNGVPRFYEKVLTANSTSDAEETKRKLRRAFGARVSWLQSGGAPLPRAVAEAYHAAGLLLLQGYGLTESSPVISFSQRERYKVGTVGVAVPGVEIAIAPDGEVLSRGPHIMKGYWNNPQATAEAIRDGWLHTGDLGKLDEDGFLSITGRKKELLVLSNGKKVVPSYIEGLLVADPCIDQAVVCGEGKNFLTALIVPHWDNLQETLRAEGQCLDLMSHEEMTRYRAARNLLQRRIDASLRDVSSWEQVKKFIILPHPLTVANDELTVSLKLRRNVVVGKYRDKIEGLYGD